MDTFDNCRERKHRHLLTRRNASIPPLTLAFAVVACRLLLPGCRAFAACSAPASSPCAVVRNDPETVIAHPPTVGLRQRSGSGR
jgi:hypothetical protein